MDPITALLVKAVVLSAAGTTMIAWGMSTIAQTGSAADGWVVTGGGVVAILGLVYKLLTDHTTVTREHETMSNRILALESEVDTYKARLETAAAKTSLWQQRCHDTELAAARLGVILPPVSEMWHRDADRLDDPPE